MIKRLNKGFTLGELLTVTVVVAVLSAVAIPTFSNALEAARESSDLDKVREAYTLVYNAYLDEDTDAEYKGDLMYQPRMDDNVYYAVEVGPLSQTKANWQSQKNIVIDGVTRVNHFEEPQPKGYCRIEIINGNVSFYWNNYTTNGYGPGYSENPAPDPDPGTGGTTPGTGGSTPGTGGVDPGTGGGTPGTGDPLPPQTDPGNTIPLGSGIKGNEIINVPVSDLPQQPTEENVYVSVKKGDVYVKNGRYYVAVIDKEFHKYYFEEPNDSNSWMYIELDLNNTTYLHISDFNGTSYKGGEIKRGTIYQKDNEMYVRLVTSNGSLPTEFDQTWLKINIPTTN
ncbi:MAG: prepilin-type N-terminal cleavage/methylation domain-containing protein [Erysipelotrichaceae bacterium]|nr:prepilin-type N-terminal cleavage/methylation domain-containing protein [Erysipelotrichaceae bacterium]